MEHNPHHSQAVLPAHRLWTNTKNLVQINPEDEDTPILSIPYSGEWNNAWLTEPNILHAHNGIQAAETYNQTTAPQCKKTRKTPPTPPHRPGGWQPQHTTYTTQPINPDQDAEATCNYEIAHHPTTPTEVLIHSPTGQLIEIIAELTLRQKAKTDDTLPIRANPLHKYRCKQTYQEPTGTWIIPDSLYDGLNKCFNIQRVLHYDPITLPLRAKQYIYQDPLDSQFGATPYTDTAWPYTSLAIPD